MQQHDVIWKSRRSVDELPICNPRQLIRKVAVAALDAALQRPRAPTLDQRLVVIVVLQRNAVRVAETIEKVVWHMTEVGCATGSTTEAVDHEPMRAETGSRPGTSAPLTQVRMAVPEF
jgi:hypothetical protein